MNKQIQIQKEEAPNLREVEGRFNSVEGLRGESRKTAIAKATNKLYNYLKAMNYGTIDRRFLNSFFGEKVSQRTRQNVIKAILTELLKKGVIVEAHKKKTIVSFRTSQLFSQDYGSYAVMMEKNRHRPKNRQGIYSMGNLSIRKDKITRSVKAYQIL